jgi:heptosyltransferase-2
MKILIIQQKMIGDVLVAALYATTSDAYPDAQIDYLVYESTTRFRRQSKY